jgi:two-component system, NarL family, nitrate/nitrite response regulator NarL
MLSYHSEVAAPVVIVDPQPFFCVALAAALEGDDIHVAGWTTDELRAEELTSSLAPVVVLTELDLSAGSGLDLIRRVRDRTRVLLLTRRHEGDVLLDAVGAGAFGCASHETGIETLRRMIVEAADGRFAVDPDRLHEALRRARTGTQDEGAGGQISRLTSREREVLRLLAAGMDDERIAHQLYLSVKTARTHVANILHKLGVHSRAEAARLALRAGATEPSPHVLTIEGPSLGRP